MKKLINLTKRYGSVIFCGWLLCISAGTLFAQAPGWSRGQQNLALSYDDCVRRMPVALQNEGYGKDPNSGGNFVAGSKDVHTAIIICSPAPDSKMLVQIVVASNGDGGGLERQRLQAQMENPGSASSACQSPAGTWNWWNGTVVTFSGDGTAQNSTGLTGSWRLESGRVNVVWSNNVQGHYIWAGDGNTMREMYNGREETMHRQGQCSNP